MRALFGQGLHPDAERLVPERTALYVAAGESSAEAAAAAERDVRLGRRFPTFAPQVDGWSTLLAAAYAEEADRLGLASSTRLDRASTGTGSAAPSASGPTAQAHGRDPASETELRSWIARQARPPRQPVAGYDLVFTPVKSVSVLWALADPDVARAVEDAHHAAVAKALAFVEDHAALTRTGSGGLAQVDTHGLVVAMFDHRDSRSGDPNLHTHAAVSTKVQGRDGKWRSLDGRVLFNLAVAASETYNTAVEDELRSRLGVTFTDRTPRTTVQTRTERTGTGDDGLRAVREIDGIDPRLLETFASRRAAVETDYAARLAAYRRRWGHEPSRAVQMRLAQEATLATRPGKDQPRSLEQLRVAWMVQARQALGAGTPTSRCGTPSTPSSRTAGTPPLGTGTAARTATSSTSRTSPGRWSRRSRTTGPPGRSGTCARRPNAGCAPSPSSVRTSGPRWSSRSPPRPGTAASCSRSRPPRPRPRPR